MFVLRLQEHPVPVGTDDPDVLLAWILDTMGLVRRRNFTDEVVSTRGSIHELMKNKLLTVRAAENVVRLLPPLNVTKREISLAIKIIEKVCKKYR